ncbi:MAG: hypothetical protein HY332_21215 [Chloroflexi bacterium]|nr:hypothetical protein [Chloroflexota bacterium]
MAINMVLTSILGLVAGIYGLFFTGFGFAAVTTGTAVLAALFGLVFHRHACGAWVGFLHGTGAISERRRRPSSFWSFGVLLR